MTTEQIITISENKNIILDMEGHMYYRGVGLYRPADCEQRYPGSNREGHN